MAINTHQYWNLLYNKDAASNQWEMKDYSIDSIEIKNKV